MCPENLTMSRCKFCADELNAGGNWSPGLAKQKRLVCRPCFASYQKSKNAAYREKPENREKARQATIQWRIDNPDLYQAKLERARKPK